jgi:hypothetical protein
MLRKVAGKPWVRFHALPDSVRYAKTDTERGEIRRRATILADETVGREADCWLVQCRIEGYSKSYQKPLEINTEPQLRYRDDDDDFHWVASVSRVFWQEEVFNDLLKDVADEATGPTLWCNRETGKVFAPYDGGFDIFPTSTAEVAELKERHKAWLSSEPSGL